MCRIVQHRAQHHTTRGAGLQQRQGGVRHAGVVRVAATKIVQARFAFQHSLGKIKVRWLKLGHGFSSGLGSQLVEATFQCRVTSLCRIGLLTIQPAGRHATPKALQVGRRMRMGLCKQHVVGWHIGSLSYGGFQFVLNHIARTYRIDGDKHQAIHRLCLTLQNKHANKSAIANSVGGWSTDIEVHHIFRAIKCKPAIPAQIELLQLANHRRAAGDHTLNLCGSRVNVSFGRSCTKLRGIKQVRITATVATAIATTVSRGRIYNDGWAVFIGVGSRCSY